MGLGHFIDQLYSSWSESNHNHSSIVGMLNSLDQSPLSESVDSVGDCASSHHGLADQITSCQFVGFPGASEGGQDVIHPVLIEAMLGKVGCQPLVDDSGQSGHSSDDLDRRDVKIRPDLGPLANDLVNGIWVSLHMARVDLYAHVHYLKIKRMNMQTDSSMIRTALVTLVAPIMWGTTYVTVTELLPPDRPIFVAAIRVLPAGLVLIAIGYMQSRWVPKGRQWRDLTVLATFNFAIFFPLLIGAIYRLPGGVAASVGGVQPLLVALISWRLIGTQSRRVDLVIGLMAAIGVGLVVVRPGASLDLLGVLLALGANISFSTGVVLTKSLPTPENRLAATGWQLTLSSMIIVPLAFLLEGPPPSLSGTHVAGFVYLSLVATGLAFALWFRGVQRLSVQAPPLLGLAAPITGASLGWLVLGEELSPLQLLGFVVIITAVIYGATLAHQIESKAGDHQSGELAAGR